MGAQEERRARLLDKSGVDAYLVFSLDRVMPAGMDRASLRYLAGYTGEGALLVTTAGTTLVTDSRYLEQAKIEVPGVEIVHAESDYLDDLAGLLRARKIPRIGYSAWRMTDYVLSELTQRVRVEWIPQRDPVRELRAAKDEEEVALLQRALKIAEQSLEQILPSVRPGANEADLAFELTALIQSLGADGALGPTVASGPNSALPHYVPALGRRALREGDLVLFDFGAVVDGYVSDITRTFVLGRATPQQREIYAWVDRSVDAGLASLRAGASGGDVHRAASAVIEESPYAEHTFLSPVGHGVGLEVHELPSMGPGSGVAVPRGAVVTMEPGIYIPGYGGVRIEEMALVTEVGCQVLNESQRIHLVELPL
ncbi:MAG: M24 family metallopeptidase [Candidatus Bipolaricaulia bacterium]